MNAGTRLDLRSLLRSKTRDSHDALDSVMSERGWTSRSTYSEFLKMQYAARKPVEAWIAAHSDPSILPPPQIDLIKSDLREMDAAVPAGNEGFAAPEAADPVGAVWALAGSSLGNQMILRDLQRPGTQAWPMSFLSEPAMPHFFKQLRPRLEARVTDREAAPAIRAARAVFDHFLRIVQGRQQETAA